MSQRDRLDDNQVDEWLGTRPLWRRREGHLVRDVRTRDYPGAARIVAAQVAIAEGLNHHPLITLGYNTVTVELWTHDRDGVTGLDLNYAQALDELLEGDLADFVI